MGDTLVMEAHALESLRDVKKAKLQVQQADYDARAKKAEYIPDVSLAFDYYTTANFEMFCPATSGPWVFCSVGNRGTGA